MDKDSWLIPPNTTGVAMGVICCTNNGSNAEFCDTGAMRVADVTACLGRTGFQSLDASSVKETGFGSLGLVIWFDPFSKISIICLMGVIPAIGSFEKGKLNAMAPTSRLSMYTGEPDIPPITPVFATFGPVSRAIIADCRAP